MELIKDHDVSMDALSDRTVAVLGYGNQGRAQALNLRDNGVEVIVGNQEDSYKDRAAEDGFKPMPIADAARAGDCLLVLTTDESQPVIWDEQIAPGVEPGNALVWASGYNVGYNLVTPSLDVDVLMVAPRMTGHMVRNLFEAGSGALAQFAVHQDATGNARDLTLALCKGIGLTRGGVFESSLREEAELDLFAEQVIWSGFTRWILTCFELGVEVGFSPELMVMELYASGEMAEIVTAMTRNGFFKQMTHHSTTSQYGTLSRGPELISDEMRAKGKELFMRDIREGAFVKEWSDEQAGGAARLAELTEAALSHPMSKAEEGVIASVQATKG